MILLLVGFVVGAASAYWFARVSCATRGEAGPGASLSHRPVPPSSATTVLMPDGSRRDVRDFMGPGPAV